MVRIINKIKLCGLIFTILTEFGNPAEYSKLIEDCPFIQSYVKLSRQKYFIDKSLLIQNIFEKYCFNYFYITAPRGFGKTTIANIEGQEHKGCSEHKKLLHEGSTDNGDTTFVHLALDMIHFFAQTELNSTHQRKHYKHTSAYKFFINRKISGSKKLLQKHLARYEVIRLDLKIDLPVEKNITEEIILKRIATRAQKCYQKYKWILPIIYAERLLYFGPKRAEILITYIENAISGQLNLEEATESLLVLSRLLHFHFRKPVIVIVDSYDYLVERIIHRDKLVRNVYSYIDRILFETFETGVDNIYLGFIFGVSGLPLGKTDEEETPDYVVIDDEYTRGDEERKRMYRWAFLDDHRFTPYLGFSETDLMVLNRKYNSNESEKVIIKKKYNGYMTSSESSFYNTFLVTKYFADKTNVLNSTQTSTIGYRRPQFDQLGFIDKVINKNTIREKMLRVILYDRVDLDIKKTYKKRIYLNEFFDPNSKTSISRQTDQIFTYLFEQGYLSHSLKPDHMSIPNLEIKEYLLKRLQNNYEEMRIDVKKCSEVIEEIFTSLDKNVTSLEVKLKQRLRKEFDKLIESPSVAKFLEYQNIAYIAAFNSKYRTNGEIMLETRTDENKGAQVLLLDSQNKKAMIVEVRKVGGMTADDGITMEYRLPNITHIKYLTINVHKSGPMVIVRQ